MPHPSTPGQSSAPLVRLADRIRATETYHCFDPVTMDRSNTAVLRHASISIGEALRADIPVIVADAVAEYYYAGTDKEHWEISEDFPGLVPPFPAFWVEWTQPSRVRSSVYGTLPPESSTFPFVGVLVHALPPGEAIRLWGDVELRAFGELAAGARWIYRLRPVGYIHDALAITAGDYWVAVGEDGTVLRFICAARSDARAINGEPYVDMFGREAPVFIHPALLTLTFMNLRNGALAPPRLHAPERFAKNWERKHDTPLVRYRTVVVDPGRTSKPDLSGPESGRSMPIHLVRGTIVTYADEDGHRLFGKYHGTFFRPPHARGNRAEGIVLHDYDVRAPRAGA